MHVCVTKTPFGSAARVAMAVSAARVAMVVSGVMRASAAARAMGVPAALAEVVWV